MSLHNYAETGANFYEDVETGMGFTNYSYAMASLYKQSSPLPCGHVTKMHVL